MIPRIRVDIVVTRVGSTNHVVVRIGNEHVAVRCDGDSARRVEPRFHQRTVVAGEAFAAADHLADDRFAQHQRAGAERHDHHDEDEGAA